MTELPGVLAAFLDATGCMVSVWAKDEDGRAPVRLAAAPRDGPCDGAPPLRKGAPYRVDSPDGNILVAPIPGPRRVWIAVGPCADATDPLDRYLKFLLPVVSQYLQSTLEVEHAANELAERYEEINLLYTITEILGRTVSLEEAAATILREISETVGARRGSILVHDRVTDTLQAVAALGVPVLEVPPIAVGDECSVSARVFREERSLIVEDDEDQCESEVLYRRGAMLSVPIMWTAPNGGSRPLGVVNLSDRRSGQAFSAGDQKLITAIATQIGTAIQNSRLVRASLSQQRLVQELALAHDLQMKLLPAPEVVAPGARVAARVIPTESVGGDFYNLFRLGRGRTGVMIGDVSSHGYRAALIMALAMSASAIHAQSASDPGEMLASLYATLREELRSTEMFISAFYGIIDRTAGTLRYANAGHPHAFRVRADGKVERLPATDPPLGMVEMLPSATTTQWERGKDLLVLFTDGVADARNRFGMRLGEQPVLDLVRRYRTESPDMIVQRVFDELAEYAGETAHPDDLAMVVVRS
ncbi:MAG TPA: GAF domain-containing SpoIIE family protein phosphatase [Gemmatimonadaceae bacterium]|nr:GAF domain-containing SpoIIE family protein phosphatase [Gemmatimonadaceae bacterium]